MRVPADFERNVFLNCPFDKDYEPLLRALVFTLVRLGYRPRIATECSDSAQQRLVKICNLIGSCRYAIHDLSRLRSKAAGELYRMNMPFELGIDYGARAFAGGFLGRKKSLILEREKHQFRTAISDLSGVDIQSHGDDPIQVVRAIRNWFVSNAGIKGAPAPQQIWDEFNTYLADFYEQRKKDGFSDEDLNSLPVTEQIDSIQEWLAPRRSAE